MVGSPSLAGENMSGEGSLWDLFKQLADQEGVVLFDVDLPTEGSGSAGAGVLRVYITRKPGDSSSPVAVPSNVAVDAVAPDAVAVDLAATGDSELDIQVVEGAGEQRTGISLEQCSRVSRRILDIDENEKIIPEGCDLEVSSPGINRRLRRPEHFIGAVGERLRLKFRNGKNTNQVITGMLKEVRGDVLSIEGEDRAEPVSIRLRDVKEARVDFRFA